MKDFEYYNKLKETCQYIKADPNFREDVKSFITDSDKYFNIIVKTFNLKDTSSYNKYKEELLTHIEEYLYKLFKKDSFPVGNRAYKVSYSQYQEIRKEYLYGPFIYIDKPFNEIRTEKAKFSTMLEINIDVFEAPRILKKLIEFTKTHSKIQLLLSYSTNRDSVKDTLEIENGQLVYSEFQCDRYEKIEISNEAANTLKTLVNKIYLNNKNIPVLIETNNREKYSYNTKSYISTIIMLPFLVAYLAENSKDNPIKIYGKRFIQHYYVYNNVIYHQIDWLKKNFRYKNA